jgi:hypothetical protein
LNTQECSLVPPISEDEKFQEEEPHVNQVEISQQEFSSLPITVVVQEQLDHTPLQQEEPLLVQPEDVVLFPFPTISHPEVVLQDPELDQSLDIRVHHDPVELRMMEVFQQVDAKSFNSHAFVLIAIEIPCSKSQPTFSRLTPFSYGFTNKYIKAVLGHMRFHGGSP